MFDFRFLDDGKTHLPAPGSYRVEWLVEIRTVEGLRWVAVPQSPPLQIQVADGPTLQSFRLELTPAALAAAF